MSLREAWDSHAEEWVQCVPESRWSRIPLFLDIHATRC
jgi:hypothetical protein